MAERSEHDRQRGLAARPALGAAAERVSVTELDERALVTVVLPYAADGADEPVRRLLGEAFGCALPALGESVLTAGGERLLGLQRDRLYVLFELDVTLDPERALRSRLDANGRAGEGRERDGRDDGGEPDDPGRGASDDGTSRDEAPQSPALRLNDQSDSWVMLRVAGAGVRRALERLCPLDLHPDVFPVGAVARTVMEHLGVIVLREAEDDFVLLSARSSAASFLHEIETSIRYTRGAA